VVPWFRGSLATIRPVYGNHDIVPVDRSYPTHSPYAAAQELKIIAVSAVRAG
jgi:hypothetical protein